jgi:hypothetical protein
MKNAIFIFGLTSLLIGCTQSATSVFKKDPIYGQNVQYSKVIKSIKKENVNAIFNITYLNSVDSSKWNNNKQNFLIGTYISDKNTSKYTLKMNGLEQISSTLILKDDKMYENIAFKNHWAEYHIVTFPDTEEKSIVLTYTHPKNKTISVSFIKE